MGTQAYDDTEDNWHKLAMSYPGLHLSPPDRGDIMSRNSCQTCTFLEEYYRLKVTEYAQASTAPRSLPLTATKSDDLLKARNIALRAGHALLHHWLTCEERIRKDPA
jgi:hypothetical protein